MYLISSCLVGINCRYNGTGTLNLELKKMIDEGKAIAVCPEVLGGLSIPREPCEIQIHADGFCVIGQSGTDYTASFRKGAEATLELCKRNNVSRAVLQSRSPSCGYGKIYDGSFNRKLIAGNGLTAELLHKNGIEIFTDESWPNQ